MSIPRRAILLLSGGVVLAAKDFWTERKPAEWSEKDVQRLLTHSPWAKEVTLDMPMGGGEMGNRSGRGGRGGGGGGNLGSAEEGLGGGMGVGGGGRGGRGGGGGGRGGEDGANPVANQVKTLVRWESARPIREAVHKELPQELGNSYVLSVLGLRLGGRGGEARGDESTPRSLEERLKESAQLQRKGSDPIYPSRVQMAQTQQGPLVLLQFPYGSQPIHAEDKEVVLHIAMGRMELRAKFALKDMVYDGQLAL